jgi:neutral ceramidase
MKELFLYLIYTLLSGTPLLAQETGQRLLAGTAKINITPHSTEPLHDSVYARTLVLQSGDLKIALVSVDLGIFTSERIQKICKEQYGISEVLLCSSHNHSGPHAFQPGNPYQSIEGGLKISAAWPLKLNPCLTPE